MAKIEWSDELNIGIEVIDHQHRRIVDYINDLEHAHQEHDRAEVQQVVEELVDYTQSHFGFEEEIMREAGYPFLTAHRRVHELFVRRVGEYQQRWALGEDVTEELQRMLRTWLLNHIRREDADYAAIVRAHREQALPRAPEAHNDSSWSGMLKRFFRRHG